MSLASKVSPHNTRRNGSKGSKGSVVAPVSPQRTDQTMLPVSTEQIQNIVESAMESAVSKIRGSIQEAVRSAVDQMATTIGQQLASDLNNAIRNVTEELEHLARRLKVCEERLNEIPDSTVAAHQHVTPVVAPLQKQRQAFDIDRLEQYSRRENVRIRGIPCNDGEDTTKLVLDLAKECGVEMSKNDISTSHRLQAKNNSTAPVIVRFVRKEMKIELMRAKKVLKAKKKQIFIDEDLTPLRARMYHSLRKDPDISAVWTRDGRLHCIATTGGKEKKVVIDSPDDLFQLGWSEDKMRPFYV